MENENRIDLTAEQDAEIRGIDAQASKLLNEMGQFAFQKVQLNAQMAEGAQKLQQLAAAKQKRLVDFATWHRIETDTSKTKDRWVLDPSSTPMALKQLSSA